MKTIKMQSLLVKSFLILTVVFFISSCKKSFLDAKPYGQYSDAQIVNKQGLNALLTGAYGGLVGHEYWRTAGMASDDAYKGSNANDTPPLAEIEAYHSQPANVEFYTIWVYSYDGIARCNSVLRLAANPELTDVPETEKTNIIAQARFLRGHFHFGAQVSFNKVPFISETATGAYSNAKDIWPDIEADFKYAYDNLPETQDLKSKANKWAAACYLAKAYMFEHKFDEAKALFDVIIANGKTSNGLAYGLQDAYWKNFDANYEHTQEDVFSVSNEASGTTAQRAGNNVTIAFPYGGPFSCCGFYQPTQNLVNAFRTDAAGLPFLTTFNDVDVKNDEGIRSEQPFVTDKSNLDSRLDWTVGRRGIYYWDWDKHPGFAWIRDQGYAGPYSPKKHVFAKKDIGVLTSSVQNRATAKDYAVIRFDDVLLMAAEAEVEAGSLETARDYVNRIRARAANPVSWVKSNISTGDPADANYVVGLYNTPWTDQDQARTAVRFERRLELAMEEHRFYDLVRWGIAAEVLNTYLAKEKLHRTYLNNASFTKNKNEYFPIPAPIIDLAAKDGNVLTQTKGY